MEEYEATADAKFTNGISNVNGISEHALFLRSWAKGGRGAVERCP